MIFGGTAATQGGTWYYEKRKQIHFADLSKATPLVSGGARIVAYTAEFRTIDPSQRDPSSSPGSALVVETQPDCVCADPIKRQSGKHKRRAWHVEVFCKGLFPLRFLNWGTHVAGSRRENVYIAHV